jgi:hypothetical protein
MVGHPATLNTPGLDLCDRSEAFEEGNMAAETEKPNGTGRQESNGADKSRLRVLWIGLCLYLLIVLNAMRLTNQVPYQALVLGGLVNLGIIISIFVAISKVRKRMRQRNRG